MGDLELEEAHRELQSVKELCRKLEEATSDKHLHLTHMKKALDLVAGLMQIDLTYIVQQMTWTLNRRFELTDQLASHVVQQCANMRPQKDGTWASFCIQTPANFNALWDERTQGPPPDADFLKRPFSQKEFLLICYNCRLVDSNQLKGVSYGVCVHVFIQTLSRMQQLKRDHATSRTRPWCPIVGRSVWAGRDDKPPGMVGRVELEILLEQLWAREPLCHLFKSPFDLVMHLLRTALVGRFSCT